jgi:hypothetical protein
MKKILLEKNIPNPLKVMDHFEYQEIDKIKKYIENILNEEFSRIFDFNDIV